MFAISTEIVLFVTDTAVAYSHCFANFHCFPKNFMKFLAGVLAEGYVRVYESGVCVVVRNVSSEVERKH